MPDITQLVMNHPYFIYFTSSYFTPKALQQSSQCLLLPENLIRICAQQCRKHTELKKLNTEIPDKWRCDASREIKTWSCVFSQLFTVFPLPTSMIWVHGILQPLHFKPEQLKTRTEEMSPDSALEHL